MQALASSDTMEGEVAEADLELINSIASDEEMLSVVLAWILSHPSNASASSSFSKAIENKLNATSVFSFAVSFLNYIRSQTFPFLQSATDQADSSLILSNPEEILVEQMPREQKKSMLKFGEKIKVLEARTNGRGRSAINSTTKASFVRPPEVKYEDEYPALGSVPSKEAKKKGNLNATKQARRVNPTPSAILAVDSSFVLANLQPSKESELDTNKDLAVHKSLKVDMDVLMDRCSKTRNHRHPEAPTEDIKAQKVSHLSWPMNSSQNHANINSKSKVKDHLPQCFVSNGETQLSSEVPCIDPSLPSKMFFGKLKRFAEVHAKLIMNKMVPSLIGELYFLLQLLSLEGLCGDGHDKLTIIQEKPDIAGKLFKDEKSCSFYACKTLEQAAKLLDCVGEQLLATLIEQPAILCYSPSLLPRLRGALAEHQSAALRSFKAYESAYGAKCALQESPNKFREKRPQKHLPMAMPTSSPFQAARDSRNNFRTIAFQRIYNNREQCRDHFFEIIREAASSQSAFGFATFGKDNDAYIKLHQSVQSLSKMLMVENYPWFSELFIEQYLQASSYGETDPEVTGLARHNAAKLHRLHDRLTSESNNQPLVFLPQRGSQGPDTSDKYQVLSTGNTWNKAKLSQSSKAPLPQGTIQNWEDINCKACLSEGFSKAFPQSTRTYILFLEAADSYRLNSQLLCSIRSKMHKLIKLPLYSRDVADIGASFTQRVLSLKSLGCLMGFIFFYPEAGSLPPIPPEIGCELSCSESDIPQCHPPIDLLEELDNARSHESLLLVLPWILDFLGILKVVPSQATQPYFGKVFSSLKALYSLPMLDPSKSDFGVSSVCILVALDSFFEDMSMLNIHCNSPNKAIMETNESDKKRLNKDNRISIEGEDHHKSVICGGIDRMLGIIDTSYIQHCCPLLMAMKSVLVAAKGRKMPSACSQTQRNNYIRKITPIQNSRESQSHAYNNMLGESIIVKNVMDNDKDQLKLKLQHVFLEQRPNLQRLVDFIVDTTAVNAAHAASLKCVPQILEDMMNKLQVAIMDRFPNLSEVQSIEEFENMLNASNFEEATEHIVSTAIQQVLPAAIDYARRHSADRTVKALSALAAPDESPYVLSVAGGIASEAAAIAVNKKTLANVSSEIRKRITRAIDDWRKKIQKQMKGKKLLERVHQEADVLTSRCMNIVTDIKEKDATCNSSTSMLSVQNGPSNIMVKNICGLEQIEIDAKQKHFPADGVDFFHLQHTELNMNYMALKAEKIARSCHKVSDCCSQGTLLDGARNSLRLHLASVCVLIESILANAEKGLPLGGFDAIVFEPDQTFSNILLDEENFDAYRIENGLVRRSIALAAYWCLILPWAAFGFTPGKLVECSSSIAQNIDLGDDLIPCLDFNMSQAGDTASECQKETVKLNKAGCDQHTEYGSVESGRGVDEQFTIGSCNSLSQSIFDLQRENNEDCPMKYLVFMWKSLIKTGVCNLETVISEFFSPWRWQLALHKKPWDGAPSWFGAAANGILNTMVDITEIVPEKTKALKLLLDSFEGIYGNSFCKFKSSNEEMCQEKREFTSIEAKRLIQCISIELMKLKSKK
ncbi:hypothetical protein SUGI_0101140 [Cryptomeria japonica]|uniref:uncharacterized protein LOC131035393 isoform X2 n=1 Tax=Cryptomeria japonica TaxID=3369 RepID=UPI002408CC93|nr:uncharacterized protein LOC131035393 isoform X2 [Cryptomeria japonica]GLJ09069.1 hypothetical protein SUGI_0101140 [Cryptomeria japonica]